MACAKREAPRFGFRYLGVGIDDVNLLSQISFVEEYRVSSRIVKWLKTFKISLFAKSDVSGD